MSGWDKKQKVCGNCAYWSLGGYQHDFAGADPIGTKGYHTDGAVSECRRNAPTSTNEHTPGANARWPQTGRNDSCGEFRRRASKRAA